MQAAIEAGARWCPDRHLLSCASGQDAGFTLTVRAAETTETYRAEFVVDATGRTARLAGSLGARPVRYDALIGVAAFFEGSVVASLEEDSFTLVEAVSSGW